MPQALKAIYCNGAFILQTAFELPEGTQYCSVKPFLGIIDNGISRVSAYLISLTEQYCEGTEVELLIQSPQVETPPISDLETKRQFLKSLIERMQQNPIAMNAPRFTRDMLHERR